MARPRKTPQERAHQRRRIQQAATELYNEGGRDQITVRSVAERAEQSTGTLYSYFANLDELLRSLWFEPVAEANRQLTMLVEQHESPAAKIRALLQAYLDFATSNPDILRGALLFVRRAGTEPMEPLDLADLPFYQLLVAALAEGAAAGSLLAEDPPAVAQVLWSGIHGAIGLPVNAEAYNLDSSDAPGQLMIELLLRSIVRAN